MTIRRLLYVQPIAEKGGMEVNLLNELRFLDRERFAPIVACLQHGPLIKELAPLAELHTFEAGRFRHIRRTAATIGRLVKLIRSERVDLIVCENALAHVYGRSAAFLTGRSCILHIGGIGGPLDSVQRLAFWLGAQKVIANSDFTRRALISVGISRDRIVTVHCGIDVDLFDSHQDAGSARKAIGVPLDVPLITTVGRLQRTKGQDIFLRAAQLVALQYPTARFLVVGESLLDLDSGYPEELTALVRQLGLKANVSLTGFRADIAAILVASDIVVVPSVGPEGFGLSTVEGMAACRPVVATNHGATPEIICHNETGVLVSPGSVNELADALLSLLKDGALRQRLGEAAARVVRQRFTIRRSIRQYEHVYAGAMGD